MYVCVCVRVCVCVCVFFFSFLISILYVNVRNALIKKYLKKKKNPDLVHAEKNIHRSHGNWFLYINQARFSLVMLRTARLDSAPAEPLKSALTDKALRGRDRMDTSYVAECTSRQV